MPIDNLDSDSDQTIPEQFPPFATDVQQRETSSEAALRGYASLGLTRKQDEPEPIPQDAVQPITNGGQPY